MKKIVVHMECQRNTHKQHDLLSDSQRGLSAKNKTTYNGSKRSLKQNSTHSDDASCKCNKKMFFLINKLCTLLIENSPLD